MTKIAYLVFAYKNPQLLKRAIKTLSTEHCAFFVHIDQKIDINQFSCISADNVVFTERVVVVMPSPEKPISRINTVRFESDKPVRRLAWRALAKLGLARRNYRQYLGGFRTVQRDHL